MKERDVVLESLRTHSLRIVPEGQEFTLASGERSRIYIDVRKTIQRWEIHAPIAHLISTRIQVDFKDADSLAGVVLGGCHLASVTAYRMALDAIFVRTEPKKHGTGNLVEGPLKGPKSKVVLLEDVVTTGGSSLRSIQALQDAGYDVLGVIAVVDRRAERGPLVLNGKGFKFLSLFTVDDIVGEIAGLR